MRAHKVYAAVMYFAMLRRDPDSGGFNYWVGLLDGGTPGAALVNGLLYSAEYDIRFLPVGNGFQATPPDMRGMKK